MANNELIDAIKAINDRLRLEQDAEEQMQRLRLSNIEALYKAQVDFLNLAEKEKLEKEQAINLRLIKMGHDAAIVAAKTEAQIDAEEAAALSKLDATKDAKKIKAIKNRYQKERKFAQENADAIAKAEAARDKEREKQRKKEAQAAVELAKKSYASMGLAGLFGAGGKAAREALKEEHPDWDDSKIKGATKVAQLENALNLIADLGKQISQQAKTIGQDQAAIDTRLQGSNNAKSWTGSYWKSMSDNIIKNVGMSPFIKQADAMNSLKTLVGKGIAFNVEQRAFLDTISAKIADTFEATDATLVKLVRIQQADTTAARLGMESALTAFLNSMYETTEYMTEAADQIRTNLYEAQALMGAAEATAFEYQVQKWMGSLYSVGFSNTQGLSGALGKLAAGDISGINDGGYGNLLIMAANRAGLSIADMLKDGLDDSDTNKLMEAMVEYLHKIYYETKDNKVVAQQFANVYGLTASDLKAAANLYGSTGTIAGNNLSYSGMINRLQHMANTMALRTNTGEMMDNLFENLKYSTASSMASNPVLYATYLAADLLEGVTGGNGIALPFINAFGTGFDLHTSVAQLMKVGALGGSALSGIGKMIAGMTQGGTFNPLAAYGINGTIKTLSRGSGTGISAMSGVDFSEGGYIGNTDSGDVQNATTTAANDEGASKVEATKDASTEVTISTVNDNVVNIYTLLERVTRGEYALAVKQEGTWTWSGTRE